MVEAVKPLIKKIPNLKVIFAGTGYRFDFTKQLARKLKLDKYIDFVGYRKDVDKLYNISDVLVSASEREGLPVSIIEAMASGLSVICPRIRGHVDLITQDRNGLLYPAHDAEEFRKAILKIFEDVDLRKKMSQSNIEDVARYSLNQAIENMKIIYEKLDV